MDIVFLDCAKKTVIIKLDILHRRLVMKKLKTVCVLLIVCIFGICGCNNSENEALKKQMEDLQKQNEELNNRLKEIEQKTDVDVTEVPEPTTISTLAPTVEPTAMLTPTEAPVVEPTEEPTLTVTGTATPRPTSTPTPKSTSTPTPTPKPTSTPTPKPTSTPKPTATVAPISFSGKGAKVISGVSIPYNICKVVLHHDGKSNFVIVPYDKSGDRKSSLVNEIGNYSGAVICANRIDEGMLEVKADGNWSISFEPIEQGGTSNITGSGSWVSPFFTLKKGMQIVSLSNEGKGNFIVTVYDETGKRYSSLANEIGDYTGEAVFNGGVDGRKYCISVMSRGKWSVDFGLTDKITTLSDSNLHPSATATPKPTVAPTIREDADIRNCKWGDSIEIVKEWENATLVSTDDGAMYTDVWNGYDVILNYGFTENELFMLVCLIAESYNDISSYIDAYNDIKNILSHTYGDAENKKEYVANWENNRTDITLALAKEDNQYHIIIIYLDSNRVSSSE